MTHAKKLKKAIRARAAKTGESYTIARKHVLAAREKPAPKAAAPSKRSVLSDASAVKATGRGFDHWFAVLDAFGAPAKGHTASAAPRAAPEGQRGSQASGPCASIFASPASRRGLGVGRPGDRRT